MESIVAIRRSLIAASLLGLFMVFPVSAEPKLKLHFFTADNCPACADVHPIVKEIDKSHPDTELLEYQVWRNRPNMQLLLSLVESRQEPLGTPALFIGDYYWIGFNAAHKNEIESVIRRCLENDCPDPLTAMSDPPPGIVNAKRETVAVPLLGTLDAKDASLPVLTVTLGLLDSINPCAFFVLLFLLGLLVHSHSHTRMLIIGGVFIFFSGLIYFLFMAAWLNIFLLVGGVQMVTILAGLIALTVATLNIKDFFLFKHGVSLSMSDGQRGRLSQKVRSLVYVSRFPAMIFGTIVLSIAANSYELLCTAGFPMVFTRVLTLHELPATTYYLYLVAYNIVYVLPLLAIVIVFSVTLGSHKLSEWQGRGLKLASGMMMLVLGLVLLVNPALLNSVWAAVGILGSALAITTVLLLYYRTNHPEVREGTFSSRQHK